MVTFSARYTNNCVYNLETSHGYFFCILQHFAPKLCKQAVDRLVIRCSTTFSRVQVFYLARLCDTDLSRLISEVVTAFAQTPLE